MGFREIRGERKPRTGESSGRSVLPLLALSLPLFLFALLLTAPSAQAASAPTNTAIPTISGTPKIGQSLTAAPGTWSADPPVDPTTGYSYQWQACGPTGLGTSTFAPTGTRPYGIVFDSKGNLYTANFQDDTVTKITPDGTATIHGSTGRRPNAIAIDANDNVYTANYVGGTVTKITPDGTSSTLGTTGTWPWGIALDSAGNVYTSNSADNTVTKITPGGSSSTFGSTGAEPAGIVVDPSGTVFVTNYSGASITRITSGGSSNTSWATTSPGPYGLVMDGAGNLYTSNIGSNNVTKVSPTGGAGTTLGTTGSQPWALTLDAAGNVFTANADSSNVTRITPGGSSSTFGTTGTTPRAIALDAAGNVYTGNWDANNVTKITACEDISSATNATYTVQAADQQKSLKVKVTASNGVSPDGVAYSATSQVASAPTNDSVPTISGTPKVRETLTALPGTWSGYPTPTFSYEWQRCDTNSGSCTGITGTNSSTYVVQPADVGKYMRVQVTASNGALPNGVASSPAPFSGPVQATASQTLYVNKYSPNQSSVPGCATAPYTQIGTAWPSPSGAAGDAVSGDTIFICGSPSAASAPITSTTGPYNEATWLNTKSLTFVGEGPERTILDGQDSRTLFFAGAYDSGQSNSYLNLQSMTVKRGLDIADGGGIEAFCRDMAISNVHFTDNRSTGFGNAGGGGINVSEEGQGCPGLSDVTVNSSVFTGNVADRNLAYGEGGADGGAIRTTGSLTISESRFEGNEARATAASGRAPRGGAVWAGGGVSITDSSFISNSAQGPGALGGAIYAELGNATITGSTFSNNSATGTNSFAGAVRRQAGNLTVTNSTFTGNQVTFEAPAVSASNNLTLVNVTSSANEGPHDMDAGGMLSIGNSIINETGQACRAPSFKLNSGGNVISTETGADCDPFAPGGQAVNKVAPSAIELQSLADNGGPTKTMALGLASVAGTSAGSNLLGANPKDQRGFARPLTSQSSGAYQLTGPENTAIPQISGTAQLTQTLTASNGSWTVSPPITGHSYQWQRCEVSASPSYVSGWGGSGSGDGQFSNPEWVAADSSGNVFVADQGNNRVQKFDAAGNFLGKWGSAGSLAGQFQTIGGIAVGPGGDIYVSDSGNNRVQQFTNAGEYIRQWGSLGTGDGQFNNPTGIATDASGNVYVSDYNNQRVQKFTSSGGFLTKWGSSGSGPGQFVSPGAIATDPSGNVYVVDIYSQRVEKFTSSGTFLTQWGSNGSGNGQFTSPTGIAVDSSGNVYVADRNTSRIQAFSPQGTFLLKWGTSGNQPGEIDDPSGLAFGAGGDLYEADSFNARIQRFAALNCAAILGGTEQTYRPVSADLGKTIRVRVTATNGVDPAGQALSAPTAPVEAPPPPPPPSTYVLSVAKSVADTGKGTVTSTPSGINCGTTCQKTYDPGTQVTLTANASPGSRFTGWTGACTNQQGPCTLTMTDNRVVTARFTAVDTYRLTVSKQGSGQGTVTSTPAGIDCGSTCESSFNDGEEVTLTASAAQGSSFTGWSGACTGSGTCQVTMSQARQVSATFTEDVPPPPPFSDVGIELNTAKPAKVPASRVVEAVEVSCEGDAPCRIDTASATARARKGKARIAPASFPSEPFPAGSSRIIQVTIPQGVYEKLRRGKKSGLLTVNVRAQGTDGPREKTIKVGLQR